MIEDITPILARKPLPNTQHASVFFNFFIFCSNEEYKGVFPVTNLDAPAPTPNLLIADFDAFITLLLKLRDK